MTKKELFKILENLPDESEIDIYDLNGFFHRKFEINTESYFNYDLGVPIITFHLLNFDKNETNRTN